MSTALLLAALTVTSAPGVDCPAKEEIAMRLRALGTPIDEADVHVRFSAESGKRAVEIEVPGAPIRRLEHAGGDCASLGEATIALLSVLLDARPSTPSPPPPASLSRTAFSKFRVEAAALLSSGLVASPALGVGLGLRWRPVRVASFVIGAELWPAREHAAGQGSVIVGATTLSLGACAGPNMKRISIEGCILGYAGVYALSATGFPIIHPAKRALFAGELALRVAFAITPEFGVFARGGAWLPFTPLDVTVRGENAPFATASVGPDAALGCELGF